MFRLANCLISRSFLLKFLLLKLRVDIWTELQWLLLEPWIESTPATDLSCCELSTTTLDWAFLSEVCLLLAWSFRAC